MTGFRPALTFDAYIEFVHQPFLFSDERKWEREWEQNRLDYLMDRIDLEDYETAVEQLLRREP